MLYTKHRKIQKAEITGRWGDFDIWEDFGETWGEWEYEWQSYTFAWLKVPFVIKNVLRKVDWIGYEGLKKYLGELLPKSFYRRWGWFKWDEIFKEKIFAVVFDKFVEPIIIRRVSLATYAKFKHLFDVLFPAVKINVFISFNCSAFISGSATIQTIDNLRWGDIVTWGDFPNDKWSPL